MTAAATDALALRRDRNGRPPITVETYHQAPGVSHSRLELFRRRRRKFHAIHIAKTMEPDEPTDAMRLGTLVDLLVLTPEQWNDVVAPDAPKLAPDGKKWLRRKGSKHEAWWQEYEAGLKESGLMVVDREEREKARAMRDAVLSNKDAARLLAGCTRQTIIEWTDEETGLACRSMRDGWNEAAQLLVDLKTCRDASPRGFSNQAAALGYARQGSFYQWGHHEVYGTIPPFVFICVETSAPHAVAVYELDEVALERAGQQNRTDLLALAKCYETNDWREPFEREINLLSLPKWAEYEERDWSMT